ncbi:MAG: carboxymuconolactone decarboxylase family protein [Terriglobales bacterium]
MARRLGWDEEILTGLANFEALALDPPTVWALRLAERVAVSNGHVDEEFFAAVRAHFDEGQMIELLAVIGLFSYFNRFNNALEIPPTAAGDR